MNECKNCQWTFEGRYCSNCGQKYIERYKLKDLLNSIYQVAEFNHKLFRTIGLIMYNPGRLMAEYSIGNSKRILFPLAALSVIIGTWYLTMEVFYQRDTDASAQLDDQIGMLIVSFASGMLLPFFPFFKQDRSQAIATFLYLGCGFFLFFFILEFLEHINWVSDLSLDTLIFSLELFTFLIFPFWFAARTYRKDLKSLFLFVFTFYILFTFWGVVVSAGESVPNPIRENSKIEWPNWTALTYLESNSIDLQRYLLSDSLNRFDIDKDGIDELVYEAYDTTTLRRELFITSFQDKSTKTLDTRRLLMLNENMPKIKNFQIKDDIIIVILNDSSRYELRWNGQQFYGEKMR